MDNFKELETAFHAKGHKKRYLAALLVLAIACLLLFILDYCFA